MTPAVSALLPNCRLLGPGDEKGLGRLVGDGARGGAYNAAVLQFGFRATAACASRRSHSPSPKPTHHSLLKNLPAKMPSTVRDIPMRSARAGYSRSILPNIHASAACNIRTHCRSMTRKWC